MRICDLEGYENVQPYYEVHPDGTITGSKPLKTYLRRGKYAEETVDLATTDETRVQAYVHRLVALAYVDGRTAERNEVDHIDGDRHNNRAENLRWVTHQENMDFYMLRVYKQKGEIA